VSCPIDRYSHCRIELVRGTGWVAPPEVPKSFAALRAALNHLRCPQWGGRLRLDSIIPRERGYGSSTADIGATLNALARALGKPLSAEAIANLAVSVEPSDSTLFPGLALFAHRDGRFHKRLGPAPPLMVLVLDPGGGIDTVTFNRIDHRDALNRLAPQHREAFDLLQQGLAGGDRRAVGKAATLSATAHQEILHSPLLDPALHLARDVGALGVCRAHSGTLIGLLIDPKQVDVEDCTAYVSKHLPAHVDVALHSLVNGGPRVESEYHGSKPLLGAGTGPAS
jgi:L-threonine kinase